MAIDRTIAPEIRPFEQMAIPEEHVELLANGITLHTYSGGDQPVCRLSMLIPYNAAALPSQALPSLLPGMILAGSRKLSADEIDDRLDFCGVRPSGKCTPRFLQLTANLLTKHSAEIFRLLADTYSAPAFDDTRLEAFKSRIIANILTARSQPMTLATEQLNRLYYGPDHWMARVLMPGEVAAVTSHDLGDFHRRIFNPSKIHIFLSGQLGEEIIEDARQTFGMLTPEGHGEDFTTDAPRPVTTPCTEIVETPESFQSAVAIGIPSISRRHPDYIPLRYTVMALGGYFGSRLMSNIREDKGMTYHISAVLMGNSTDSLAMISALCDKSFTQLVVGEITDELLRLAANPPAGDELARLKLHAMTELAEILDNPANVMGYYVTRLLVGTPADYFEAQQRVLESLTPDVISAMASRYLTPERMITVTTT